MSARIEDVLAEHQARFHYRGPQTKTTCSAEGCNWEAAGDNAVAHRSHVAEELNKAGFGDVAQARKDALNSAADDVRQVREEGLRAGQAYSPYTHACELWLRARAEDSPAPVATGDGGARPEAGGEASSPDVETSQPDGLGEQEGEKDGKQGGVHPDRARESAEGPGGRGVHGGPGVLDRSGPDSACGRGGGTGRQGLTEATLGDTASPPRVGPAGGHLLPYCDPDCPANGHTAACDRRYHGGAS